MEVRIIRKKNRRRTVQARLVGDVLEVLAPMEIDSNTLEQIVHRMEQRAQRRLATNGLDDRLLSERAERLNRSLFGGNLKWSSIQWVTNQDRRFGSCTPSTGHIRISHRLARMPAFVLDYVIVHELAHLVHPGHGPAFWHAVNRYRLAERARGYLMAVGMEDGRQDLPDRQ